MNSGTFALEITFISYCIHVQAALFCVEAIGKQKPTAGDTFGVVELNFFLLRPKIS